MESMPPGVAGSEEEQRNVIRHQVRKAFASASAHFLPPVHRPSDIASASAHSKASGRSRSKKQGTPVDAKDIPTSPELNAAFKDLIQSVLGVVIKPRVGDSGEALTGSVISRLTADSVHQESSFDEGLQSDKKDSAARFAVDTHLRAVSGFYEDRANSLCQQHLQQVQTFITQSLQVPMESSSMERRFAECLKKTVHSFLASLHSCTPEEASQHFERQLKAESE